MTARHHDDAVTAALAAIGEWLETTKNATKALLVDDIVGRLHAVVWSPASGTSQVIRRLELALREAAGPFWSGNVERVSGDAEAEPWEGLWRDAVRVSAEGQRPLRRITRVHDHLHWFDQTFAPDRPRRREAARVVAFLSYKGGVGRTTALAAFAAQRARMGEHVVVVDLDLDAPGVGALLRDRGPRPTAPYGVVDYLLEAPWVRDLDITDYLHTCDATKGRRSLTVMPAGTLDEGYLDKLARADLDAAVLRDGQPEGIARLLDDLRGLRPSPRWILLDGRAGLSRGAGLLSSGVADLHVVVATASEQSFDGLTRIVDHLGARRLRCTPSVVQAECVVVQSLIPDDTTVAQIARERFANRVEDIFRDHYYADRPDDEDRFWSTADIDAADAPHRPVGIGYRGVLAFFSTIDEVANLLVEDPHYRALGERIAERMAVDVAEDEDGSEADD